MVSDVRLRMLLAAETCDFREPVEPDAGESVTVRLRVERPLTVAATLVFYNRAALPMRLARTTELFTWYEARFTCPDAPFTYHFEVDLMGRRAIVHRFGSCWADEERKSPSYAFRVLPGFHVPAWSMGALQYQIFCDRFRNGDATNDVIEAEYSYDGVDVAGTLAWDAPIPVDDYRSFRGGDLAGIIEKLDYLHSLGVEVLYLNPIFVSPSSHKYDTQDYRAIDPHFGSIVCDECADVPGGRYRARTTGRSNLEASNALFERLCEELHARSMRLILDGVFNHCGKQNAWLDADGIYGGRQGDGALWSEESPYRSFFAIKGTGSEATYESWCGFDSLPKLNYEQSESLCEEMLDVARFWVRPPFCVDGWRLDVASEIGHTKAFAHAFWRRFRKAVKEENPDAVIVAEHYGPCATWLDGTQWDSRMNYDAFMDPLTFFLTGMERHCEARNDGLYQNGPAFFDAMARASADYPWQSLLCAMNELSNHDHARFLTRTKRVVGRLHTLGSEAASEGVDKAALKEAVAVQMTWPGAPTIYYGDEAGLCGWTDPDNRRCFPWDATDDDLVGYHRTLAELRSGHPSLRLGALVPLGCGYGWIAFGRFLGDDRVCVFVNNTEMPLAVTCRVRECGVADGSELFGLVASSREGYSVDIGSLCQVRSGLVRITLAPRSALVASDVR